jgi:uncharacterized membrane protein YdjX (TVP38/TMEM64 family)
LDASLEFLKQSKEQFAEYYSENPAVVLGSFFLIYVAVTALSLPGAAVMTLAAGALFGLITGVILVSFASTIGATLAFLAARFVFGETIQRKYSEKLHKMNEGVRKEGAFYLFTLRLVPAFPFFVINLAMALTPIKTWTFYWVSQLGMFPGTIAYVYAGTELAEVTSLSDVLSPGLISAFVILGLLPITAKKLVGLIRKKKFDEAGAPHGTA